MYCVHPLPSRADIDVHGSLDELCACEDFLGKSLDEVEILFRENSLRYQENLMWMGPVAFRYYVRAAIAYVQSEQAAGDSDFIRCLASIFFLLAGVLPSRVIAMCRLSG